MLNPDDLNDIKHYLTKIRPLVYNSEVYCLRDENQQSSDEEILLLSSTGLPISSKNITVEIQRATVKFQHFSIAQQKDNQSTTNDLILRSCREAEQKKINTIALKNLFNFV